MRPSSVIVGAVQGDVQVGADEHAPTRDAVGRDRSSRVFTALDATS